VLVAGAGVAGLETVLALRELADGRVDVAVLAPEETFAYRPLSVTHPFVAGDPVAFDLDDLLREAGATRVRGALAEVDPLRRLVHTDDGERLLYDALVVACGAHPREPLPGALTFEGDADAQAVHDLVEEAAAGALHALAFVVPPGPCWQLPVYELALQTAAALEGRRQLRLTLVTPEPAPLAVFGSAASDAVARLLRLRGIRVEAGAYARELTGEGLSVVSGTIVPADRVVTVPRLEGPHIPGLPSDPLGFVPTEPSGRVQGVEAVYAAGDATAFPVKQGGIAAQQADVAARAVAAAAGAHVQVRPFRPVLRGILVTGGVPRYLRSEVVGGQGGRATVATEPLWWPPGKIAGRYLGPFLAEHAGLEHPPAPPAGADIVEVEQEL
jgi:sulfide:quinone oxidoreductase